MYHWLTVFLPRVVNFSLGSLSTNWKYPHSQSASWNDFRGPSVQALPHPLRVSLARARSLFRLLLPSACYAGYTKKGKWSLAKSCSKQNYCHACHTRFALFFPLPSCCVQLSPISQWASLLDKVLSAVSDHFTLQTESPSIFLDKSGRALPLSRLI